MSLFCLLILKSLLRYIIRITIVLFGWNLWSLGSITLTRASTLGHTCHTRAPAGARDTWPGRYGITERLRLGLLDYDWCMVHVIVRCIYDIFNVGYVLVFAEGQARYVETKFLANDVSEFKKLSLKIQN